MNRLPPLCCVGVRGEGPQLLGVRAPGQEWGPCSEGTHPGVAVSSDFSDCYLALSQSNWKHPPIWEPLWAEVHTRPGGLELTVSWGMCPGLSPQSLKGAGSWWCSGLRAALEALFWGRCCK